MTNEKEIAKELQDRVDFIKKSLERKYSKGKEIKSEIYLATNMLNHSVEPILKIMHLRWNIENNGFRTLKQRFNLEHIFIGDINSLNYIVQMIFMVFNLLELYMKIRLKKIRRNMDSNNKMF